MLLGLVVSCTADSPVGHVRAPDPPAISASTNLALTGTSALFESVANGINDSSVVVGTAQVNAADPPRAAVWRPPNYQFAFLPDADGLTTSAAYLIAHDGTIAGRSCDDAAGLASCHPVYFVSEAPLRSAGLTTATGCR